jgi:hypothetical protein
VWPAREAEACRLGGPGPANGSLLPFRSVPSVSLLRPPPLTSFFLFRRRPAGRPSQRKAKGSQARGKCPCVDHSFFSSAPTRKRLDGYFIALFNSATRGDASTSRALDSPARCFMSICAPFTSAKKSFGKPGGLSTKSACRNKAEAAPLYSYECSSSIYVNT